MSYEFNAETEARLFPGVITPPFWRAHSAQERIGGMMLGEVAFVDTISLVEDAETGQLGIDTKDLLKERGSSAADIEDTIGVLHVREETPPLLSGYIADLRYVTSVLKRQHGTHNRNYDDESASQNERYGLAPLLAAIFRNPENDLLDLRCTTDSKEQRERVQPFAISLMQYVDEERRRRGNFVAQAESEQESCVPDKQIDKDAAKPNLASDMNGYWLG